MHFNNKSILFILKKGVTSGGSYSAPSKLSSGLQNSARLIHDLMLDEGIRSKVVVVNDNNDIDREVYSFKPDIVVIEALWVVPEKFAVLKKLHPNVQWIVRIHSKVPFLANEGVAMDWIFRCVKEGVQVAFNHIDTVVEMSDMLALALREPTRDRILYLPNYYPLHRYLLPNRKPRVRDGGVINIGCFGAIRPMKNQLSQAIAAVEYAKKHRMQLFFHLTVGRLEQGGQNTYRNLHGLFEQLDSNMYQLVEHEWADHNGFLTLIRKMDLGMQMSFTETFNIVAADFVSQNVPVVVSQEIDWVSGSLFADPTSTKDMVDKLDVANHCKIASHVTRWKLARYNKLSKLEWLCLVS